LDVTLLDLKNGKSGRIKGFDGGTEFQRKLSSLNIRVGKMIKKITSQPLGGPIVIEVDEREVTIGRQMSKRILLEAEE
jgi:ferrous iron transport protein A